MQTEFRVMLFAYSERFVYGFGRMQNVIDKNFASGQRIASLVKDYSVTKEVYLTSRKVAGRSHPDFCVGYRLRRGFEKQGLSPTKQCLSRRIVQVFQGNKA